MAASGVCLASQMLLVNTAFDVPDQHLAKGNCSKRDVAGPSDGVQLQTWLHQKMYNG